MGNAKKCDRCGNLFEVPKKKQEYRIMKISLTSADRHSQTLDLCSECRESLKKWFEQPMF